MAQETGLDLPMHAIDASWFIGTNFSAGYKRRIF